MTTEKMKENLLGQFKLWHGIVTGVVVVMANIFITSWKASASYNTMVSQISANATAISALKTDMSKLTDVVLTTSPTDKQSWMNFRENTVSRMAAYEANQSQIITQLTDINSQVRDLLRILKK